MASQKWRSELQAFVSVYIRFLTHPIREVRNLPNWGWRHQILNQLLVTSATGLASGFLQGSLITVLQGLLFVPLITAFTISVATLFFYFFFQIFAGVTLDFRRLMELIFFANVPFFVFQTVSHWFPPINLFGLAFSGILMIVGLCEIFHLKRALVIRTVIGVYALFLVVWLWSRMDALKTEDRLNRIDIPHVELGK